MRDNLKDFVNANRESFDQREPSADLWNKIRPQVVPPVQQRKIKPLWKWASIAAAVLLVGTAAFIAFNRPGDLMTEKPVAAVRPHVVRENESDKKAVNATVRRADNDNSTKLTPSMAIAGRQTKRKQLATANITTSGLGKMQEKIDYVEMLQDSSSASARLSAVLALKDEGGLDRNSRGALERTAVSDQNSNVRIAAIETILRGLSQEERQQKVQDLFVVQNDPTLQMELMQMMVQQDDPKMKATTKEKLTEIVEDPFTLKFVKEQAYAVLLNQ